MSGCYGPIIEPRYLRMHLTAVICEAPTHARTHTLTYTLKRVYTTYTRIRTEGSCWGTSGPTELHAPRSHSGLHPCQQKTGGKCGDIYNSQAGRHLSYSRGWPKVCKHQYTNTHVYIYTFVLTCIYIYLLHERDQRTPRYNLAHSLKCIRPQVLVNPASLHPLVGLLPYKCGN